MRRRAAFLALALALPLVGAGRADAYVRSKINATNAKFWKESCIPITIYLNKFKFDQYGQAQQSIDAVVKSLTGAAHAWSPDLVNCADVGGVGQPYLEIVPTFAPAEAVPPAATNDHRNVVIFRTDNWTKSGVPPTPKNAYSNEAIAVTTVFATQDGAIQDADIEINATPELWKWANLDAGVFIPSNPQNDMDVYDLQTAITHEFGHLLGLEHTCFNAVSSGSNVDKDGNARPFDYKEQPVPDCTNAPSSVEQTVMFWRVGNLDTSKRVLSKDEVRFLCDVYPAANDPQMCKADQPGCATAPERRGGTRSRTLGLLAVGGLVLAAAARRARRLSGPARARA